MNKLALLTLSSALILSACGGGGGDSSSPKPPTPTPTPTPVPEVDHSGLAPMTAGNIEVGEALSGGATTVYVFTEDAFSQRPQAVKDDFQLDGNFTSGDHIFRTPHENAGPLLNTSNCQGCHLNDGRGVLPQDIDEPFTSALVKIGDATGAPDPMYGSQIQTFAEQSFTTSDFQSGWPVYDGSLNGDQLFGEAYTFITFEEVTGQYPDGESYTLRKPVYHIKDMSFGPFLSDIRFSPRVAPQVFGAGLLEAIPQENILALADENDADGDGISGKPSWVMNKITNEQQLGRFAYKAQTPTVLQQGAAAYLGDMGITSFMFPEENCTGQQAACIARAAQETEVGEVVDLTDREMALVEFYNRVLAVPARRGYDESSDTWEASVSAGRTAFFESGCVNCHTPRHVTGEAAGSVLGEITLVGLEPNAEPLQFLSEQTIFPYTDLLLHDMGGSCSVTMETMEGQACTTGAECHYVQRCDGLADGLIQGDASGTEWKTAPLWGLGLVQTVNPRATFLHDGRARTIEEAILWHGGEAEEAKQTFMQLSSAERAELLSFLESL
jgi:CxxC motif-containing protein (DUF1111 family)